MNLYKIYLDKIKDKLLKHKNTININSLKDLNSIVIENPPEKFDYDFIYQNAKYIVDTRGRYKKSEKVINRCIDSIGQNIPIIVVENSNNQKFKQRKFFINNRGHNTTKEEYIPFRNV